MHVAAEHPRTTFSMQRKVTAAGALAVAAVLLGLLMAYGGGGHLLAVISTKVRQGKPYDFRFAALLANGAILLGSGLTHLVVSRGIARGHGWALRASGLAAAAVSVYALILLPVSTARGASVPVLALNLAYLAGVAATAGWLRRARSVAGESGPHRL
jgi:hypothetical protein